MKLVGCVTNGIFNFLRGVCLLLNLKSKCKARRASCYHSSVPATS